MHRVVQESAYLCGMIRLFLLSLFFLTVTHPVSGQNATNPFELTHRLPRRMLIAGNDTILVNVNVNPFEVVPHRAPDAAKALAENSTEPFRPFSILPRGGGMSPTFLFGMLAAMFGFLTFCIAANRGIVIKAWRGFLNDSALTLSQRESAGLIGSTPYYLLYTNFILNGGMFIFLVMRFFSGETFNNGGFLLLCMVAATGIFLSKHFMLSMVRWLFPVQKEVERYNFLMLVFSCVLGLFLVPFNLLLAFSTGTYQALLVFWTLGLVAVFYAYRALRSANIGSKFLGTDQFHFLLYLCTVEIAPVLLIVKLAMIQG